MATTNVVKRNLMANKADQLNLMNYHLHASHFIMFSCFVLHMARRKGQRGVSCQPSKHITLAHRAANCTEWPLARQTYTNLQISDQ